MEDTYKIFCVRVHMKYKGLQFKYVCDTKSDTHSCGKVYVKGRFIYVYHDKV
jgi:hypothetical protein